MFPAAAFLAARLSALNPRPDTDVIVITPTADWPAPFQIIHASCDPRFERLAPRYGAIGRVSNFRAFLPAIFAEDYARILYLDTDIYPTDARPFALFDMDMRGFAVAAVRDLSINFATRKRAQAYRESIVGAAGIYLNAGVLLMDTVRYNGTDILPRVAALFARDDLALRFSEQTALNMVLQGDRLELSPVFNMFPSLEFTFLWSACPPALIHFVGGAKPWVELKYLEMRQVQDEMRDFLAQTPWSGFFQAQRTPREERRYAFMRPIVRYRLHFLRPFLGPFLRRHPFEVFDWNALAELLEKGDFADVAAGITRLDLARIPKSLRPKPA
jgi:lipopolysaccharide biosynthesis glycosyltransferase